MVRPQPHSHSASASSLPDDLKNKRIRLIHAGKALDDATLLATSLKRLVTRPPSRVATPGPYDAGTNNDVEGKSKGKLPVRDPPTASIGDVTLTAEDLATEVRVASTKSEQEQTTAEEQNPEQKSAQNTTTPAPRGFDRLLNAGFTHAEILSLRQQFMSIQAHTHTPDTMPSPDTLRAMEDQWLDNSNSAGLSLDASDNVAGSNLVDDDTNRGSLDDMIWGTTVGFFWPIGCLIWGIREEGIFSPRRKIAIVIGIVLNLGLGFIRWGG